MPWPNGQDDSRPNLLGNLVGFDMIDTSTPGSLVALLQIWQGIGDNHFSSCSTTPSTHQCQVMSSLSMSAKVPSRIFWSSPSTFATCSLACETSSSSPLNFSFCSVLVMTRHPARRLPTAFLCASDNRFHSSIKIPRIAL